MGANGTAYGNLFEKLQGKGHSEGADVEGKIILE
jgi:hypothetical protein